MKKVIFGLIGLLISSSAMAYPPEPRAKLLMITSSNTQASSPSLAIETVFTEFNSMTECTNAVWILTSPPSGYITVNGTTINGQVLPKKLDTYGNPVAYTYRCLPFGYTNLY